MIRVDWKLIFSPTFHGFRDKYRVVGFEVETMSIDRSELKFEGDTCNFPDAPRPQAVRDPFKLSGNFEIHSAFHSNFRFNRTQTINCISRTRWNSSLRR